jgi:hypothetical protein
MMSIGRIAVFIQGGIQFGSPPFRVANRDRLPAAGRFKFFLGAD